MGIRYLSEFNRTEEETGGLQGCQAFPDYVMYDVCMIK